MNKPKNYMVESILVTLFCCLPLGIVGIINASKVDAAAAAGNDAEAQRLSAEAYKWVKYGFFAGLVVGVLYLVFMFVLGGVAMMGNR
jgi:Interferon-induced transmembrane protein